MTLQTSKRKKTDRAFRNQYPFPNDPRVIMETFNLLVRCGAKRTRGNVLIVGCGTGEEVLGTHYYVPPFTNIVALEPAERSRKMAEKFLAKHFFQSAKIRKDSLEEYSTKQRFNLILCQGVLHHLDNPQAMLTKLRTLLTPDGEIVLSIYHHAKRDHTPDPRLNLAQQKDCTDAPVEHSYSWHSLLSMADKAGLKAVRTGHEPGGYITLPLPRGRAWCALYDGLFHYKRQGMIQVVLVRK